MIFVRFPSPVVLTALTSLPVFPNRSVVLLVVSLLIALVGLGFLFRFMSRPSRRLPDIDYKILNDTGERVNIVRGKQNINMDDLQTKIIDIRSDVDDLYDSYDLGELKGEEELQEFINKVDGLKGTTEGYILS